MIRQAKLISLFLYAMMLLAIFLPGLSLAEEDRSIHKASQVEENDLAVAGLNEFSAADNEMVEVLIILKEQVNTKAVASLAERPLASSVGINKADKSSVRAAVVDALQQCAKRSQASLLDFLKNEKSKGRVSEIESFFIVNIIYARLKVDLVDEIAGRPEVESLVENKSIQLVEPVTHISTLQAETPEWNINRIKAPDVWQLGIDGTGIVVGIIDTGVDLEHEALFRKYRGYNSEGHPSHAYNWFDPYRNAPSPDDLHGHGTHVAGIILGSDPDGLNQIGVAPGAQWIAARGVRDDGRGNANNLLAAGQFLLAPTPNPDGSGKPDPTRAPDIINNSWGGKSVPEEWWYRSMIQSWRAAGILPVFSAGNGGPKDGTISFPALYPESFAVAAIDNDNNLADFSGRGPTPYLAPDDMQPNISAPGVEIRSARSLSSRHERGYELKSGTSMAAPHIAGVAALLLDNNPNLSVYQLEKIMLNNAKPLTDSRYVDSPNYGFGYGLVDALAAVNSHVPESFISYGWNTDDYSTDLPKGPVSVTIPEGTINSLKSSPEYKMVGGDFIGSDWFTIGLDSNLYRVDPSSGSQQLVGESGLTAESATGLAYDSKEEILYASAFIDGDSNLYTIDLATGQATYIGCIISGEKIIGLAASGLGVLYGLNVDDNSLYHIDKSTGEGALIGYTGYYLDGIQDLAFDRDNEVLYGTLWVGSSINGGGIYELNTSSGAATMLQHFGTRITGLAIPYNNFNYDPTFIDVPEDHPFFNEIEALASSGISTGWEEADGTFSFRPALPVTRMAMAAFLVRGLELDIPDVTEPTFTDVPENHPFFYEIEALAAAGISTGWEETDGTFTFRPTLPVTRMALSAFLVRGLELEIPDVYEPSFTDVPVGHPFFKEIEALAEAGIANGWPDDTFKPDELVARQAMAAFLVRGLDLDIP